MYGPNGWLIGVVLATSASALSNLGVNLQKLAHKCHSTPGSTKHVYRESLWIWGLALLASGSMLDFVALAFAPQSLIAPLGALTLVFNIIFAPILLREPCRRRDCLAIGVIVAGSALAVLNASHRDAFHDIPRLLSLFTRPTFVAYAVVMLAILLTMLIFIHHCETMRCSAEARLDSTEADARARRQAYAVVFKYHMFLYPTVAGLIGSQNILFAKCTAELVLNWTALGAPIFSMWQTYAIVLALASTILGQLHWLNSGLSRFDSSYVLPVFQTTWLLASVITGIVFFDEIVDFTFTEAVCFIIGLTAVAVGVGILTPNHATAELNGHDEDTDPLLSLGANVPAKTCEMTAFSMVTISSFSSMYISLKNLTNDDQRRHLIWKQFGESPVADDPC